MRKPIYKVVEKKEVKQPKVNESDDKTKELNHEGFTIKE